MSYQSQGPGVPNGQGGYGAGYGENQGPYGAPPAGYGQGPQGPPQAGYGQGPYGAPPGGYGQGGYGPPAGGQGPGPYGSPGGYGPYPPPKKNNNGLILGLAIGGVVILVIIFAVLIPVWNNIGGNSGDYGSDAELDRLYDQCAAGDYAACDDLYFESPVGSEYEEFGETCGGRADDVLLCEYGDF